MLVGVSGLGQSVLVTSEAPLLRPCGLRLKAAHEPDGRRVLTLAVASSRRTGLTGR